MSLVTKQAEMLALGLCCRISAGPSGCRCRSGEGDGMSAAPIAVVGRGESPSFSSHNAAGGAPPCGRSPSWRQSDAALMRGVR